MGRTAAFVFGKASLVDVVKVDDDDDVFADFAAPAASAAIA